MEKSQAIREIQVIDHNATCAIGSHEQQAPGTGLFTFMQGISDIINVEISIAIPDKIPQWTRP